MRPDELKAWGENVDRLYYEGDQAACETLFDMASLANQQRRINTEGDAHYAPAEPAKCPT